MTIVYEQIKAVYKVILIYSIHTCLRTHGVHFQILCCAVVYSRTAVYGMEVSFQVDTRIKYVLVTFCIQHWSPYSYTLSKYLSPCAQLYFDVSTRRSSVFKVTHTDDKISYTPLHFRVVSCFFLLVTQYFSSSSMNIVRVLIQISIICVLYLSYRHL